MMQSWVTTRAAGAIRRDRPGLVTSGLPFSGGTKGISAAKPGYMRALAIAG